MHVPARRGGGPAPEWSLKDSRWHQDPTKGLTPKAATPGSSKACTRVAVVVVNIPDMLCEEVLAALSRSSHLPIFAKIGAQTIIDAAWNGTAQQAHFSSVAYRALEVLMFIFEVRQPPMWEVAFWIHLSRSFITACFFRDIWYLSLELIGEFRLARKRRRSENEPINRQPKQQRADGDAPRTPATQGNRGEALLLWLSENTFKIISLLFPGWVLVSWATEADGDVALGLEALAVTTIIRWAQLIFALRAFRWVGHRLLPIFQSTRSMAGIFAVTAFTFLGFLHVFFILGGSEIRAINVLTDTIRFLLIGDGIGINMVLSYGQTEEGKPTLGAAVLLMAAWFMFSIWIMNLFIAGTDQAYEQALEFSHARFQKERAAICLKYFVRPAITCRFLPKLDAQRVKMVRCCQIVAALCWMAASWLSWFPWGVTSAAVVVSIILCDSVLLGSDTTESGSLESDETGEVARADSDRSMVGRSSNRVKATPYFLWVCHRVDYDEEDYWPAGPSCSTRLEGRVSSLKRDALMRSRRMHVEISNIKWQMEVVDRKVEGIETKMQRIDAKVEAALQEIKESLSRIEGLIRTPPTSSTTDP